MQSKKHIRNQNACDTCRNRRVKCRFADGEVVCDGCRFLGVPCTSDRPRRKRGPPNRHAHFQANTSLPSDTGHGAASDAGTPSLSIESPVQSPEPGILSLLAPESLIYSVVDDWFEHIHPLAPILHRRQFLSRLRNGDTSNPVFCGLVISVLCATCATLRRKSFEEYYPITLERCINLIETYNLLPVDGPYSLDWCAAKYNLSCAAMVHSDMSNPWNHRVLNEAVTGTRYLLEYKLNQISLLAKELLKRLSCLLEITMINLDIFGQPALGRLVIDSNPTRQPSSYTDTELDPSPDTSIPPWHTDNINYVPGLVHLHVIFHSWHVAQTDRFYHASSQVLSTSLSRIQACLDDLPPELRWRGGLSRPSTVTRGHDVQIANIFVTSLYIRSNLLQQFGNPLENQTEHQSIVSDLLEVLYHLPQEILEANGYSLIPKIRDIGATYLDGLQVDSEADGRVIGIGEEEKGKLERLLRQLGVLDFRPGLGLAS